MVTTSTSAILGTISTVEGLLLGLAGLLAAWAAAYFGRRSADRELEAMGITDVPRGRFEWRPRDERDMQLRRSPGGYVSWLVRERFLGGLALVGGGMFIAQGTRPALVAVGVLLFVVFPLGYLGWRYKWWRTHGWYE